MRSNILSKVIALFLLIEIPIVIISCFSFSKVANRLETEIIRSLQTDSIRFAETLDTDIKEIRTSNTLLGTQHNLQKLAINGSVMSAYQKAEIINMITEQLSNICTTNPYLESAHIYIKREQKVCHTKVNALGSFSKLSDEQWNTVLEKTRSQNMLHQYEHPFLQKECLSLFIVPSLTQNPLFIVEFTLSKDYLAAIAEKNEPISESMYYLELSQNTIATNLSDDVLSSVQSSKNDLLTSSQSPIKLTLGQKSYYYTGVSLPFTNGCYITFIPTAKILRELKVFIIFFVCFFVTLIASSVIFYIGIHRMVHRPLTKLINAFKAFEHGIFDYIITDNKNTDFSYLYKAFNKMSVKLSTLIEREYEQKILVQKAELKQLQAQINPHFLYNTFFLLQSTMRSGLIEESQQMAELLGIYFQYITRNSMEYVPLEEEYRHAQTYVALQSLRFKERIDIQMEDIPAACKNVLTPKMILQPILENSFNHGLKDTLSGGIILLHFETDANSVRIIIEDNGTAPCPEELNNLQTALQQIADGSFQQEMSGLLNIHRRLCIYSDSNGKLEISGSQLGGLKIVVNLDMNL